MLCKTSAVKRQTTRALLSCFSTTSSTRKVSSKLLKRVQLFSPTLASSTTSFNSNHHKLYSTSSSNFPASEKQEASTEYNSNKIEEEMLTEHELKEKIEKAIESNDYNTTLKTLETLILSQPIAQRPNDSRQMTNVQAMKNYLERLNLEEHVNKQLKIIHVAGTKGKGSTCAFCESVLRSMGLKTGLYTSPHLIDVRERIRVNGVPVSKSTFVRQFWECWYMLENTKNEMFPSMATYFRFLTLMAFKTFVEAGVDVVILEVGVGGRLDATNVVTPVVCGITSIGYDHMDLLGDTLEKIAGEKAGIIKPHIPCFTYSQKPEVMQVFKEVATKVDAPLVCAPPLSTYKQYAQGEVELGLEGEQQELNASLALALCNEFLIRTGRGKLLGVEEAAQQLLEKEAGAQTPAQYPAYDLTTSMIEGLENVRWPCRGQMVPFNLSEKRNLTFYIDGAHTDDSLKYCVEWFIKRVKQPSSKIRNTLSKEEIEYSSDDEEFQLMKKVETARQAQPSSPATSTGAGAVSKPQRVLVFYYTGHRFPEQLLQPLATAHIQEGGLFDKVIFCVCDSQHTVLKAKTTTPTASSSSSETTTTSSESAALQAMDPKELSKLESLKKTWHSLVQGQSTNEDVTILPTIDTVIEHLWLDKPQEANNVQVLITGSFYLAGDFLRKLTKLKKITK